MGMEKVLNISMGLVEQYGNDGKTISNKVRASIKHHLSVITANILGEYFSKVDQKKSISNCSKISASFYDKELFASYYSLN
jgi:outer membrane scaffolding protein for murein synthesis (MipA/OmpV family)